MVNYDELPLFPLQTVLYPGMPLPLHIFEPRYLEMIAQCIEHDAAFGVVLIRSGSEVGAPAEPHTVGTIARISHAEELPDGKMNIVVIGESRFKILDLRSDHSYLTAVASPVADTSDDDADLPTLHERVCDLFREYLKTQLAMNNRTLSALQLPREPSSLAFAVANAIEVPLEEKQALLELGNTALRLDFEMDLLSREIRSQVRRPVQADTAKAAGTIHAVDAAEVRALFSRN